MRLEAAADGARSLAEMGTGVVTPFCCGTTPLALRSSEPALRGVARMARKDPNDAASDAAQRSAHARSQAAAHDATRGRGRAAPGRGTLAEVQQVVSQHFTGFGALACAKT